MGKTKTTHIAAVHMYRRGVQGQLNLALVQKGYLLQDKETHIR
jgi:hypothetical protein